MFEKTKTKTTERRLECVFFGKPYVPSSRGRTGGECGEADGRMPDADVDLAGNSFVNLMDPEVRHTHFPARARTRI